MAQSTAAIMDAILATFQAKDKAGLLALFADDAVFTDPHYPTATMQGIDSISSGMDFAFGMLEQPGFSLRNRWLNGDSGVMEVDTHHRLVTGQEVIFPQVFVVETGNGKITRLQSYVPYPPPAPPTGA